MMVTIDPKRTGVKASMIPFTQPPMYYDERNRLCGPIGTLVGNIQVAGNDIVQWILCCPGCGEAGSPMAGKKWQIVSGSVEDVTTLTLSPSIQKSCCGWHGHLKAGIFESC